MAPGKQGPKRKPRRFPSRTKRLAFDPDPQHLVVPAAPAAALLGRRFRILRPDDLVVLDVLCWDIDLVTASSGPVLRPVGADSRLEVRFPFQHLGEKAYFRVEPVPPNPVAEPPEAPPIPALAARWSRLVFAVPAGERIEYSIEGVLAAMSRLPLLVAPVATPRAAAGLGANVPVVTLTGGLLLARTAAGVLVVTEAVTPKARRGIKKPPPPVPAAKAGGGVSAVLATATELRTARAILSEETAVDLSGRAIARQPVGREPGAGTRYGRGFGDLLAPMPDRRPSRRRPKPPTDEETAIEAPFRLIISPSDLGAFAHSLPAASAPVDPQRVELWHSRLGVRRVDPDDGTISVDESRHPQRVIRAIWARDKDFLAPGTDPPPVESPFRMSLNPRDRVILVRQTADPAIAHPEPVDAKRLYLSSLGAYLDLHGRWEVQPYAAKSLGSIESWDHEAPMGRDQFVQVVYPGYLFPFGFRASLVKVTERKILEPNNPKAYLYQRKFIVVGQPVRAFDDRRMPFRQIGVRPLVTPDIDDPGLGGGNAPGGELLFWPAIFGKKFAFTLDGVDHAGRRARVQAPLLFVAAELPKPGLPATTIRNTYKNAPERNIGAHGQSIAYAATTKAGDTSFETSALRFLGEPGPAGSLTSTPELEEADVVVPAMRHLAPEAPTTTVNYAAPYLTSGFTAANTEAQVFLALKNVATIKFDKGTDKAGGFVQPDLPVRGLSRALGAVGDIDDLVNKPPAQKFNPAKFLDGVLPKLFGLFKLTDILKAVGLDGAPSFITEQLDRVASLLADLEELKGVVARSVDRLADEAANAATAPLRNLAQDARNAINGIRAQLENAVDDLVDAVGNLLDLETPSSLADVTAAVSAALGTLAGIVDTLAGIVRNQPLPAPVKAELERLVGTLDPVLDAADLASTIDRIAQFVNGIDPAGLAVRARFNWRPTLTNFPDVADDDALFIVRPDGFLLSVEARASGASGVGVDVLAELREFALNLFPGAPLMRLAFDRIAFRAASGRKPEVDVVFRGIEFVGVLSFIETLKRLIPFDAFSDPPYLDVSTEGVTAGFDLGLPAVAVGVFALENISLGADVRVPFLGEEALTVGFHFCTRDKPFRLTVMMIGGGGFVGIRLSPKGLVLLEMSLEAGACLSINLGVASGSVSIMVGVYLRLEAQAGSLTGYFRIRGEVDVLGLISASITLELSLTYEFQTGKMVGRASLEIEVEVFFFSFSVTVSCERRLAGSNGDPTFEQQIGVLPDGTSPAWGQYCAAFAEV
ncbi:MAG: hypothetical protein ACRD2W_00535 [Acidimicrobiales bacterium]